jgi:hypothetical protein
MASVTMLWDGSLKSWLELGVTAQPAAILFDRQGRPQERWQGPFDEDEVLALARRV